MVFFFKSIIQFLILRSSCNLQVRDEIEHLLDDDNDMAEMYLTEKLNASKEEVSDEDDDR